MKVNCLKPWCRIILQITDVPLFSSGSALRSSAYSDAILHIRCHWHAGKLSPFYLLPSVVFSSPPCSLL